MTTSNQVQATENSTEAHRGEPLAVRAQKRRTELVAALAKLPADDLRARNDIEVVVSAIDGLLTGDVEHLPTTTAADLSRLLENNKHLAETARTAVDYQITKRQLEGLSDDQQTAIMESLVLAVAVDGETSKVETDQFEGALNAIPWRMEPEQVIERMKEVRTRVLSQKPADTLQLIQQIGERLSDPGLRVNVFHAVCSVMVADGSTPNDSEKKLLMALTESFGLSGPQIDAIKADLAAKFAP